ncbi:MAG: hypothetical protein KQH63_10280 [Desulfobulbaceae bacterium]|nr:hypothetical protein [Desulfobulbaceae bacterium]
MPKNLDNPLNMVPDPFAGDTFVLSETDCTDERKQFFVRMNEIQSLLFITKHSFDVCKEKYDKDIIPNLPSKANTPIKLEINGGNFIAMPAAHIIGMTTNGINLLTRQAFVMFYGSFETFLFQLFEKSFPLVGITENILDKSRDILMRKKWDGKFCKMSEAFYIEYKAGDLKKQFNSFEMEYEGEKYNNPLNFLDKLAQVRHRIVHASSILENDRLIVIDMNIFHGFFVFFFLLTDFVDNLFAKRFGYRRHRLKPIEAGTDKFNSSTSIK